MSIQNYNRTNFHKYTFCIFNEASFNAIKDVKPNYRSKSGSSYYFTSEGVFRLSNHWSRVANCRWRLVENSKIHNRNSNRFRLGYAKWTQFYPDNNFENLYFLEVNYETKSINYYHKLGSNYTTDKKLRTASEAIKLAKQIRSLFEKTAWTKYIKTDNIEEIRKQIIEQLINTNDSFQEIRKQFL